MGFHPLQTVNEDSSSCEVDMSCLGDNAPFNFTPWPEGMSHHTPRSIQVGAEQSFPVLTDEESWSSLTDSKIDNAFFVDSRLDCIRFGIVAESDGTAIGVEGKLVVVKAIVIQCIRRPKMRSNAIRIEYLGIELTRCPNPASDDAQSVFAAHQRSSISSHATLLYITCAIARWPLSDSK